MRANRPWVGSLALPFMTVQPRIIYLTSLSLSFLLSEWGLTMPFLPSGHVSRPLSVVMAQWPVIFYTLDPGHIIKTHN